MKILEKKGIDKGLMIVPMSGAKSPSELCWAHLAHATRFTLPLVQSVLICGEFSPCLLTH